MKDVRVVDRGCGSSGKRVWVYVNEREGVGVVDRGFGGSR